MKRRYYLTISNLKKSPVLYVSFISMASTKVRITKKSTHSNILFFSNLPSIQFKLRRSDFSLIKRKYKEKSMECSNQLIDTESSEEKEAQKETNLPQLHSLISLDEIVKGHSCFRTHSNEMAFEEWFLNREEDLSFFLDDCLNWLQWLSTICIEIKFCLIWWRETIDNLIFRIFRSLFWKK